MVVGSEDGKIRLFSSTTLTMAKTSIPGLGAAITRCRPAKYPLHPEQAHR